MNPARNTLSRTDGWYRTRHNGRVAYRRDGGWLAWFTQGAWHLWRDGAGGTFPHATYRTARELNADLARTRRVSREPRLMHQERRPRPPRETDADGGWSHDDPRWK